MNSTATKIIAVVIVIAVIGAGVAVFIMMNQKSDSTQKKVETKLAVYGNANNDLVINADDIAIIQDIIDKKSNLLDYPLADANCDGTVTSDDIEFTNKIIDKTAVNVNIQCLNKNGNAVSVNVDYPLKNVVGIGSNMLPVMINSGIKTAIAGYYTSSTEYPNVEKGLPAEKKLAKAGREITPANWTKFTDLDTSLAAQGGIGAFLVDHSLGSVPTTGTGSQEEDLKTRGIPQIRLAVADPVGDISATMLLGFLVGGDAYTASYNYAEKSWKIVEDIQSKVSGFSDSKKKTYIGITMSSYIACSDSTFGTIGSYVGGLPYYSVNDSFKAKYSGTGSEQMSSVEALSNYAIESKLGGHRGIDFIFSNRSVDFLTGDGSNAKIISEWEKSTGGHKAYEYFKDLDCYDHLYYINNLLPGAVKLAYVAAFMYPDEFSVEDADGVASDFASFCETMKGTTKSNTLYTFGLADYNAAKNPA